MAACRHFSRAARAKIVSPCALLADFSEYALISLRREIRHWHTWHFTVCVHAHFRLCARDVAQQQPMVCCTATARAVPPRRGVNSEDLVSVESQGLALRGPCNWQWLEELFHFEIVRLPAIQNRLDNVGREERKGENLADVGSVY